MPRRPAAAAGPVAPVIVKRATVRTLARIGEELVAWFKTLVSAAVYATLIVTFGFQVARVEGQSMAPTLEDQDRLIVNKLEYRLPDHDPRVGDIVMLLYPNDPDKSFVKRVVGEPGDTIRSVNGRVYRNDVPLPDDFIPEESESYDTWGPEVVPRGLLLRDGRPPEQQLRQPHVGLRAEEIHHRQGPAPLVAARASARDLRRSGQLGRSAAAAAAGRCVDRVDHAAKLLFDHAPLHLQRRRQLAARHRQILVEKIANFLMRSNCARSRFDAVDDGLRTARGRRPRRHARAAAVGVHAQARGQRREVRHDAAPPGKCRRSPTSMASATSGCCRSRCSIGCGAIFLPPDVTRTSFLRSVMRR